MRWPCSIGRAVPGLSLRHHDVLLGRDSSLRHVPDDDQPDNRQVRASSLPTSVSPPPRRYTTTNKAPGEAIIKSEWCSLSLCIAIRLPRISAPILKVSTADGFLSGPRYALTLLWWTRDLISQLTPSSLLSLFSPLSRFHRFFHLSILQPGRHLAHLCNPYTRAQIKKIVYYRSIEKNGSILKNIIIREYKKMSLS